MLQQVIIMVREHNGVIVITTKRGQQGKTV